MTRSKKSRYYRTKPCQSYLAGSCSRGDACTFIHDQGLVVKTQAAAKRGIGDVEERLRSTHPQNIRGTGGESSRHDWKPWSKVEAIADASLADQYPVSSAAKTSQSVAISLPPSQTNASSFASSQLSTTQASQPAPTSTAVPPEAARSKDGASKQASSSTLGTALGSTSPSQVLNAPRKGSRQLCRAWNASSCPRGVKCQFSHDPQLQEAEDHKQGAKEEATMVEEIAKEEQVYEQSLPLARDEHQPAKECLTAKERRLAEEHRIAEERRREEQRLVEERRRAEECRLAEEFRLAEEHRRAEAHRQVEERRLAEERRLTEERRLAEERQREEQRLMEEHLREEERALRAVQAKEDASKMIQRVVFGSIVTFGTGLNISRLITGFECCSVRVCNLPTDTFDREISALFTQQGIDPSRFLFVGTKHVPNGGKDATVIMDAESAHALSMGLDLLQFRDRLLAFEVGAYNTPGKMGQSTARGLDVLTISWRVPSARYIATYATLGAAEAKIRELDGTMHFGRKLRVEKNTVPPGRAMFIDSNSIKISNLPLSAAHADILTLAGTQIIRPLPPKNVTLDAVQASHTLRHTLSARFGQESLLSFEPSANTGRDGEVVNYRARFTSWEVAKAAHDYLKAVKLPHLWSCCWLKLPAPFVFNITIPNEQFDVQRNQWNELTASTKSNDGCNLVITADPTRPVRRIRLLGSNKATVGAMKVRVESLAAGAKVDGWHASLASQNGAFARSFTELTGTYMRADWKQRQIKVYGSPQTMESARLRIAEELARLAGIERTITLPQNAVRFFVEYGLAELRELLGEDNVGLNAATRVLTISGGEEAYHAVSRLLEQAARTLVTLPNAAASHESCPICFDDVAVPTQLSCEHVYCTSCLRYYLTSAVDGDRFPIVCVGDEGRCKIPIPIPTFEHFLPPASFTRLLEAVFSDYIAKRPHELRFCKTADCTQIYRTTTVPSELQCPSCLSVVCATCQEEGHDGMTCAEAKLHRNPAEQERMFEEWIQQQGGSVKKCPQCSRLMEKAGGCNHMTCACGAHVCWHCLGIFTAGTIYPHMNSAHGGIYEGDIDHAPEAIIDDEDEAIDVHEQQQMYARAQHFARLVEEERERERAAAAELARRHQEAQERETARIQAEHMHLRMNQLLAEQRRAEQLRTDQALAQQLHADQLMAEQRRAEQLRMDQLQAEQRRAEQLLTEQRRAEQLRAEQLRAEQLLAEQRRAEQLRAEQRCTEQLLAGQRRAQRQRYDPPPLHPQRGLVRTPVDAIDRRMEEDSCGSCCVIM